MCQTYLADYNASAVYLTTGEIEVHSCNSLPELSGKPTPKGNERLSSASTPDFVLTTAL